MSKAIRQSTTLLSVIGGCLYEMNDARMFSLIHMRELVHDTYKLTIEALREWPRTNDDAKVVRWTKEKIDEWELHVRTVKDFHRLPVLAKVCERCIADLLSKIHDKRKLELLLKLKEPLARIHDFVDVNGENFVAYAKADELMDKLYELIGWE